MEYKQFEEEIKGNVKVWGGDPKKWQKIAKMTKNIFVDLKLIFGELNIR